MAQKRDYYEVLGLDRSATDKDLKKSFRSLARKYHPDRSTEEDAEDRFKEIQEAYAVLSDEQKRAQYDRFGHKGVGASFGGGGFQGFNMNFDDIFSGNLNDIFSSMFGGGGGGRGGGRSRRGRDILVNHPISFQSMYDGDKEEMELDLQSTCSSCEGSGARDSSSVSTCDTCKGAGQVVVRQQMGPFVQQSTQACRDCRGEGQIITHPCKKCHGDGTVSKSQTIRFTIPSGAPDGTRMRMRGRGEPAPRGKGVNGDLIIELDVQLHPWFERDGADLIMSIPVGYPDLVLGTTVSLEHIDGKTLEIKIPKGATAGETLEIHGRGLPRQRGGRGNVVVLLKLHIPTKLDKATKKQLQELKGSLGVSPDDFGDKVREQAEERRQ